MTESPAEHNARQIAQLAQRCLAQPVAIADAALRIHYYCDYPEPATLDELQQYYERGLPLPEYALQSWPAFIISKPQLVDSVFTVHCLCALDQRGRPSGEYWLKLKSPDAIAAHFNTAGDTDACIDTHIDTCTDTRSTTQTPTGSNTTSAAPSGTPSSTRCDSPAVQCQHAVLQWPANTAKPDRPHDSQQRRSVQPVANIQPVSDSSVNHTSVNQAPAHYAQQLIDTGPQWLNTPITRLDNDTVMLPTVITSLNVPQRFAGHCYIKLLSAEHPLARQQR